RTDRHHATRRQDRLERARRRQSETAVAGQTPAGALQVPAGPSPQRHQARTRADGSHRPHHGSMTPMTDLARGENSTIGTGPVTVSVAGAKQGTVDLMVFQLGPDGRVRNDADFVFFNQPASPEGAVRLVAADRLSIDLPGIPATIDRLAVAVALDDSVAGSLASVAGLGVEVV